MDTGLLDELASGSLFQRLPWIDPAARSEPPGPRGGVRRVEAAEQEDAVEIAEQDDTRRNATAWDMAHGVAMKPQPGAPAGRVDPDAVRVQLEKLRLGLQR
jgi:hypothetical protein